MNFNFYAMKKLSLLLLLGLFSTSIYTQSFEGKGDVKANIGYDLYGYGNGIKATLDLGLCDIFSIGAGGSYYFDEESDYFLFARTAVHFGLMLDLPSKFDFYPGIEIGYLESNDVGFTAFIGARYFFTDNLGVYAELGNNGSLGLSLGF
jgi:hypothetical protein